MNKQTTNLSESMLVSLVAIPVHINDKTTYLPVKSLFIYDPNYDIDMYVHTFGKEIKELEGVEVKIFPSGTNEEYSKWLNKNFRVVPCPPELQIKKKGTVKDYQSANPYIYNMFKDADTWISKEVDNQSAFVLQKIGLPYPWKFSIGELVKINVPFESEIDKSVKYEIGETYPTLGFYRNRMKDIETFGFDNPDFAKQVYAPFKVLIVNNGKMDLIPLSYIEKTDKYDLLFIINYYSRILLNKLKGK